MFDNFFMKDAKFASAKFNYAVINESLLCFTVFNRGIKKKNKTFSWLGPSNLSPTIKKKKQLWEPRFFFMTMQLIWLYPWSTTCFPPSWNENMKRIPSFFNVRHSSNETIPSLPSWVFVCLWVLRYIGARSCQSHKAIK